MDGPTIAAVVTGFVTVSTVAISKWYDWHDAKRKHEWELQKEETTRRYRIEMMSKLDANTRMTTRTLHEVAHLSGRTPEEIMTNASKALDDLLTEHLKRYDEEENADENGHERSREADDQEPGRGRPSSTGRDIETPR